MVNLDPVEPRDVRPVLDPVSTRGDGLLAPEPGPAAADAARHDLLVRPGDPHVHLAVHPLRVNVELVQRPDHDFPQPVARDGDHLGLGPLEVLHLLGVEVADLALERVAGNLFFVEGDVDKVRDGLLWDERDVVEPAGTGENLGLDGRLGGGDDELERALAGLGRVDGERYRATYFGVLQTGHLRDKKHENVS